MQYGNTGLNHALELTKSGRLSEALTVLKSLGQGGATGAASTWLPDGIGVPGTVSGPHGWQPGASTGSYVPEIARKYIPPAVNEIIDRWGPNGGATPSGAHPGSSGT